MRLSVFMIFLILISSCYSDRRSKLKVQRNSGVNYLTAASAGGREEEGNALVSLDRMLIKVANIHFQCTDIVKTKTQLDNLIKKYNGYTTNEGQDTYDDQVMHSQTIRIPTGSLDSLIARIEELALVINNKNISSEDVTEEFIDVSARLATKKELEARYRDILKAAKNVEEMIAVERELNNVRSEIESMEGRVNYLKNRVQYSTINVSYYQPGSGNIGFGSKFIQAFGIGWNNLLSFTIALFQVWPFLIIISAGVWASFKYLRRSKNA